MHYELMSILEVLDPMVLASRVREVCECGEGGVCRFPESVRGWFDEDLVLTGGQKRLFVTLGQFSIVRLERDAQIVIPVLDYSIPSKECCDSPCGCAEDPCEMFSRIPFPTQQFSPRSCDGECGCQGK